MPFSIYTWIFFNVGTAMRCIYSAVLYLLSPFILLRLWWKGRTLPAYRTRIAERFCWDKLPSSSVDVWVHAVSLGEVIAVTPLIVALLEQNWSVLITTMTPTGAAQVASRFGERVVHRYVPYDMPSVVARFFKKVKPRLGVIVETELWPNLIAKAHAAHIPLMLINARLSERSLQGYLKAKLFFAKILNQFSAIGAQSIDDAQRFITLGADPQRVCTLGNMKFDLSIPTTLRQFDTLDALWGNGRIKIIIASTHEGEELRILEQLKKLQQAIPKVLLLIAPRHPERFQEIYHLALQQGWHTGLRSNHLSLGPENEVVILDSLGELLGFYNISDYAFVGGSLVHVGGHNVLEPIAMGTPVFSGPYVHNFKTICRDLLQKEAMIVVQNEKELGDELIKLHHNQKLRDEMIARATQFLAENKGAVERHLQQLIALAKRVRL